MTNRNEIIKNDEARIKEQRGYLSIDYPKCSLCVQNGFGFEAHPIPLCTNEKCVIEKVAICDKHLAFRDLKEYIQKNGCDECKNSAIDFPYLSFLVQQQSNSSHYNT